MSHCNQEMGMGSSQNPWLMGWWTLQYHAFWDSFTELPRCDIFWMILMNQWHPIAICRSKGKNNGTFKTSLARMLSARWHGQIGSSSATLMIMAEMNTPQNPPWSQVGRSNMPHQAFTKVGPYDLNTRMENTWATWVRLKIGHPWPPKSLVRLS